MSEDKLGKASDKSCDDDGGTSDSSNGFSVWTKGKRGEEHHIYLHPYIGVVKNYLKLINMLDSAEPEDVFTINISGPGGSADTGLKLLNHMKHTEALVRVIVDSNVSSMSTILAFGGNSLTIRENVVFMWHVGSIGFFGDVKISDLNSSMKSEEESYRQILKAYCSRVLSKKEINDIVNGKDIYLTGEEVTARLARTKKK